jgi:DNA-binding response OmpR family regulator
MQRLPRQGGRQHARTSGRKARIVRKAAVYPERSMQKPVSVLLGIDQPALAESVKHALRRSACLTQVAWGAEEIRGTLQRWRPHLVVIDLDIAEYQLLGELGFAAQSSDRPPIIALTRRRDLETRLAAYDQGVDDVLGIPFSPEEFVARVRAIMRRTYREAVNFTQVLRLGDMEIDIHNRCVLLGGKELRLTAIEQNLLYLLAANAGRVLTRDEILDHIWGASYTAKSNVIDRHIRNLRIRLQDDWRRPRYIATIPGRGYRFMPTTENTAAPSSCGENVDRRGPSAIERRSSPTPIPTPSAAHSLLLPASSA